MYTDLFALCEYIILVEYSFHETENFSILVTIRQEKHSLPS